MVVQLQRLFAELALSNQKYVNPSSVLACVVDGFGRKIDVGSQMDVVEYLLNFIERLEEGLDEQPQSCSTAENSPASYLSNQLDISIGMAIGEQERGSILNESYMLNVMPVDDAPVSMKEYYEFTDSIAENFFGQ